MNQIGMRSACIWKSHSPSGHTSRKNTRLSRRAECISIWGWIECVKNYVTAFRLSPRQAYVRLSPELTFFCSHAPRNINIEQEFYCVTLDSRFHISKYWIIFISNICIHFFLFNIYFINRGNDIQFKNNLSKLLAKSLLQTVNNTQQKKKKDAISIREIQIMWTFSNKFNT